MEINEKKDKYYTKELNEVDRYLLRIINRYFDLEEMNNRTSINAMIAEAMTRYKETLSYKENGVLSFNNRVGIFNVNIHDFDGEKLFEKATAFNKNFGNTGNTVCEGNDKRLYDERIPTYHHHKIDNVTNLEIKSIKKELSKYGFHIHANMNILNKLKYTGTSTKIDLKKLENIEYVIFDLISVLETREFELTQLYQTNSAIIEDLINQVYLFMESLYNYIALTDDELYKVLSNYIMNKIDNIFNVVKEKTPSLINKSEIELYKKAFNNSTTLVATQEKELVSIFNTIDTSTETMFKNATSVAIARDEDNTLYTPLNVPDAWEYNDGTIRCTVREASHIVLLSADAYKHYTHEVTIYAPDTDNNIISIILAAEEDGTVTHTLSLNVSLTIEDFIDQNRRMAVVYDYRTYEQEELIYDETFLPEIDEWNTNFLKLKIKREDNDFKIYRSEMNSSTISDTPCIAFNLESLEQESVKRFIGQQKYGYGCFYQKNSSFTDINFIGYREAELNNNIEIETKIDSSLIPADCNINDIEIMPELIYNSTRTMLPYITDDFTIMSGLADGKLYTKIQPLHSGAVLPAYITAGKLVYNIYSKRNIV